ncbi:MAG: VOC family protein [Dehalococcoidia bacterium]|nr:VOC family protein [Dehalococcoidia bacterium]
MSSTTGLTVTTIGQITQPVADLDRAIAFYRDVLGASFTARFDPPGLALFDFAGTRLMLSAIAEDGDDGAELPNGSALYFTVDDVDLGIEQVRSAGVEIVAEPHMISSDDAGEYGPPGVETWMGFFHDPDGNVLALMELRPPA